MSPTSTTTSSPKPQRGLSRQRFQSPADVSPDVTASSTSSPAAAGTPSSDWPDRSLDDDRRPRIYGNTDGSRDVRRTHRAGERLGRRRCLSRGLPDTRRRPWMNSGAVVLATELVDDLAVLGEMIDAIVMSGCVDPARIILTGESNGAAIALARRAHHSWRRVHTCCAGQRRRRYRRATTRARTVLKQCP